MKKLLTTAIFVLLALAVAGCGIPGDKTSAEAQKEGAAASGTPAALWTISIGDAAITDTDAAVLVKATQKLQKQKDDGAFEDRKCVGYTVKSVLELAGITDFKTVTAVAADGAEYGMEKDVAWLSTTMLTIAQDGEEFAIPRLAIDGLGSKAWLRDVVAFKVEK